MKLELHTDRFRPVSQLQDLTDAMVVFCSWKERKAHRSKQVRSKRSGSRTVGEYSPPRLRPNIMLRVTTIQLTICTRVACTPLERMEEPPVRATVRRSVWWGGSADEDRISWTVGSQASAKSPRKSPRTYQKAPFHRLGGCIGYCASISMKKGDGLGDYSMIGQRPSRLVTVSESSTALIGRSLGGKARTPPE